jgi:aminoglycoside 3-N-acetyltransferase
MTLYKKIVKSMGIKKGDKLYVSSDLRLLILEFHRKNLSFNVNDLIDAFILAVGCNGTIVFPTFNWGFCRGENYDYNSTPGITGSLGNEALKREDFIRTKHPIYSFAAYGNLSDRFLSLNNQKSFGESSPFELFYEYDFYFLAIDVSFSNSFTYVHHVEQIYAVPYRFEKAFLSNYIDEYGNIEERTYSMYVRDIENGVSTNLNDFFDHISKLELVKQGSFGFSQYFYLRFIDIHHQIEREIINNKGKLLHVRKI